MNDLTEDGYPIDNLLMVSRSRLTEVSVAMLLNAGCKIVSGPPLTPDRCIVKFPIGWEIDHKKKIARKEGAYFDLS